MHNEPLNSPEIAFQKCQKRALSSLKKLIKRAQKRLLERQNTLHKCKSWEEVFHLGQLLQAHLFQVGKGCSDIKVIDWEQNGQERLITLDPLLKPHEQVARYFKRSKKLRAGIVHAERQLKLAEEELERRLQQLTKIEKTTQLSDLQNLCELYQLEWLKPTSPIPTKKKAPAKPYHCFLSESGLQIWVGKSAKNNDQLTFHYANGSDWWLHARDCPGSHIIIRGVKEQYPDEASLRDAAELALRFSKIKDKDEGEVSITQVKWLKRIKSAPGKVMLSKHKTLRIFLENDRWNRLKVNKINPHP